MPKYKVGDLCLLDGWRAVIIVEVDDYNGELLYFVRWSTGFYWTEEQRLELVV